MINNKYSVAESCWHFIGEERKVLRKEACFVLPADRPPNKDMSHFNLNQRDWTALDQKVKSADPDDELHPTPQKPVTERIAPTRI
ncbi:hypothetical protein EVAR_53188_1 [Eumeta japonica]|uniref:Uncharacterized protein n=1 Tax=Eumeta variegata TaxID=151549 RepID=A0A4C1YV73_EUMVA|nr:hypothetical protein EVAR_53188_1 [Eumeta japonica]